MEVSVVICDRVHYFVPVLQVNGFVFLVVCAIVLYSSRGERCDVGIGVQGLQTNKHIEKY